MRVKDLSSHGRVWLVSARDGSAVMGATTSVCHGVCEPYPLAFSAVFVHDDRVWLQVGPRKWDVDAICEVRQVLGDSSGAIYELVLVDGQRDRVEIHYSRTTRRLRSNDPDHDDAVGDIVRTLPYTATDGWRSMLGEDVASWKARVLPLWQSGISAR